MRKSTKSRPPAVDLAARVRKALEEGRTQQALELSKALFHQEPTAQNRELVCCAYLARARELRERGHQRDSLTVLRAAVNFQDDDPAWLGKVAEQLAQSGGISAALDLAARAGDPAIRERVLARAADSAVQQGSIGREALPEECRADFDRVLQAFTLSESGQDDAAREALNGVGLRSPFLEWKLLIRGVMAYHFGDDDRARENWQRLDADRLPARLAAPLRQAIDAPFRTAQPAAAQTVLRGQFDRLQGSILPDRLRTLRTLLVGDGNLGPAFREAEALLPELRRLDPTLVERLARVFYWTMLGTGPDDIPRYQRIFGRPSIDPQFHRLQALGYERGGDFKQSHKYWQKYEIDIAADPNHWPEGQAARARALIWLRMGDNAAELSVERKRPGSWHRLFEFPDGVRSLRPTAEQCYQKAVELAPEMLEAHEALFNYYRTEEETSKAHDAGKLLLQQFPEHVPTLQALGDLCLRLDQPAEALSLLDRALRANPLDRPLRVRLAAAHRACARVYAIEKRYDLARTEMEAAAALRTGVLDMDAHCRRAAIEFKAGDAGRAEEFLAQARAMGGSGASVAFLMLTEAVRLKLPRALKTRFDEDFTAASSGAVTGQDAAKLAAIAVGLVRGPNYVGRKTHEKKALAFVDRAKKAEFTEPDLQLLCTALYGAGALSQLKHFVKRARSKFRKNPYFPYMEALCYTTGKDADAAPPWKVRPLLEKAQRLVRDLPPCDQLRNLLDDIESRLRSFDALDPLSGLFDSLFSRMDEFEDERDQDFDDEG
jgi:tetratricopeptide (TPR) repeat protein